MENIEDAEKLCQRLNKYEFTSTKHLKANLHPNSSMKRTDKERSHHKIFSEMSTYIQARQGGQDPNFALPKSNAPPEPPIKKDEITPIEKPLNKLNVIKVPEKKQTPKSRITPASAIQREKQRTRALLLSQLPDSPVESQPQKAKEIEAEVVKCVIKSLSDINKEETKKPASTVKIPEQLNSIDSQQSVIIFNNNINTFNISVGATQKDPVQTESNISKFPEKEIAEESKADHGINDERTSPKKRVPNRRE